MLVFLDGTICDDRHRLNLLGTQEFYAHDNMMKDQPVLGSVDFLNYMAKKYEIIYIGARSSELVEVTHEWIENHGFPKGKVYLAPTQHERVEIVKNELIKCNIEVGIGDRWDDNQLHLILGCKSVIVQEYNADWDFVKKYM